MKIYITGVSGTGKSTVANKLKEKGLEVISIDEESFCAWFNKKDQSPVEGDQILNKEFVSMNDWVCNILQLRNAIEGKENIVVVGIASNQNEYLKYFDKVILLQCDPGIFIERLNKREDNDFGKDTMVQEWLKSWYEDFDDKLLLNNAVAINANQTIEDVVADVIEEMR